MASSVVWVSGKDPVTLWVPAIERWSEQLVQAIFDALNARTDEIREWMKQNHVWKNRTYLAEELLGAQVRRDLFVVTLYMYHGWEVYYSKFLELYMQRGRFSVLTPALDYWGSILLDDVRKVLG